jgi:hypothetical protein
MPFNPAHTDACTEGLLAEVGTFPSDGEYVVFDGHPLEGGAEVPEIPRIPVTDVVWAAHGTEPKIIANMDWGNATGPAVPGEFWVVVDADDTVRFYEEFLPDPLVVTAAGPIDSDVEMYYPDEDQEF